MRRLALFTGTLYAATVVCLALFSSPGTANQIQGNFNIDDIRKAWAAREEKIKSFSASWKVNHTYVKGSLLTPSSKEEINPGKLLVPKEDYTFPAEFQLKVAPKETGKVRCQYLWQTWHVKKAEFIPGVTIEVFDGKTNTLLNNPESAAPMASVRPEPYALSLAKPELRAIALALRPSALPPDVFNLDALDLINQRPVLGDIRCLLLTAKRSSWSYWVDPTRGFSIVRCVSQAKDGTPRVILDVDWFENNGSWLPKTWHLSTFDLAGTLRADTLAFDVEYQLNEPFADADFDLTYRPRTLIVDGKDRGRPAKYSVIADDGSKRNVTRNELLKGKVFDVKSPTYVLTTYILSLLVVAVCVAGVVFVSWKYRGFLFKGARK